MSIKNIFSKKNPTEINSRKFRFFSSFIGFFCGLSFLPWLLVADSINENILNFHKMNDRLSKPTIIMEYFPFLIRGACFVIVLLIFTLSTLFWKKSKLKRNNQLIFVFFIGIVSILNFILSALLMAFTAISYK